MPAPRAIAERLVDQVRHLAKHLLMCAPMLVVAGVLVASGAGVIAILPVLACVLMMTLMMGAMGRSGGHGGHG